MADWFLIGMVVFLLGFVFFLYLILRRMVVGFREGVERGKR
jgi:flagellar biogenesis protein FliO